MERRNGAEDEGNHQRVEWMESKDDAEYGDWLYGLDHQITEGYTGIEEWEPESTVDYRGIGGKDRIVEWWIQFIDGIDDIWY